MNVIFDFDGTLVDSFQSAIDIFNVLANEFGFRKIIPDDIANLRELNSREFIKYLKIPFYKMPTIIMKARKLMRSRIESLLPFPNCKKVLTELKNTGFSLGILTSNSAENVTLWLKQNDMVHLFDFINSSTNYFGKAIILKKILQKNHIQKSEACYVGDETRDIDAAKQCGVTAVAVTWGFNSEQILLRYEPHYLIRKPEDLLNICR